MRGLRLSARIALSIIVPVVLTTVSVLILGNLRVRVFLTQFEPLDAALDILALVGSVVVGYWFVVQPSLWRTRKVYERRLLIIAGLVYFPVMLGLMMYWALAIVGRVYGVSL